MDDLNEKSFSYFKTPYLTPEQVQEGFNIFINELKKHGWVKWSHDANTFRRKPTAKDVLIHAFRKLKRNDVRKADFGILLDWFKVKTSEEPPAVSWNPTKFATV